MMCRFRDLKSNERFQFPNGRILFYRIGLSNHYADCKYHIDHTITNLDITVSREETCGETTSQRVGES